MPYKDLREFIQLTDEMGELVTINGVHWENEIGALVHMHPDAVLIDNIPGYPAGYRVLINALGPRTKRYFQAANWSSDEKGIAFTNAWRQHLKEYRSVPPEVVTDGPVMENVQTGKDIDLFKFPVPKWHEEDGGRYIGTLDAVITKDPDTGQINLGTYRMQVHDKAVLGLYISEGKDGNIFMNKLLEKGKPCPVVAVFGADPALLMAAGMRISEPEYELAGWLKTMPEEVIIGKYTGLPLPARAEVVIEGEVVPGDVMLEGPFGEGTGYSEAREAPVVRVKAVYHRNNPILTGQVPFYYAPGRKELAPDFHISAMIWNQLEGAGIREVKGVASFLGRRLHVVSIRNSYAGHSTQAGLIATQCHAGAYLSGWVVVVDEDIDPTCLNDVLWRMMSRIDAKRAIKIIEHSWSSHMSLVDPSHPFIKADYPLVPHRATYRSAAVIDACLPVEWDPSWHRQNKPSQELEDRVMAKFGKELFPKGRQQRRP